MKRRCPDSECFSKNANPKNGLFIRKGWFFRRSDGQWIRRYRCKTCGKSFSSSSLTSAYRQKKRSLNFKIERLLTSGVSQRRIALNLGINRKTVVRKFKFLAIQARLDHDRFLAALSHRPLSLVQFDDLETSEHSKCKPLSVALAVDPIHRKILGFQVSAMPAKGPLAGIARLKYGPRPDRRPKGWNSLFQSLRPIVKANASWISDQNSHYPRHLRRHHPEANHFTVKGRRGCIAGQGELKKIGFDPLFALNHTCAMLRANLNRLFRRTWCTTKKAEALADHLAIYVRYTTSSLLRPGTA